MITEEERESIIAEAIERCLRLLPEVVTNLMISREIYDKLTNKFYSDNPEFQKYKPIVQEIVSRIEGQDPTKTYEEILREATPKIKEAIELRKKVTMDSVERKNLDLKIKQTPKLSLDPDFGEI